MDGKYIDLHVHTNFSDGTDDISTVIAKAKDNNVGTIAFTEHYNMSSYHIAKKLGRDNDIEVIPGIEIGADMTSIAQGKKHICHILGYYVSQGIYTLLDEYEMDRYQCVLKTLELLKRYKINLTIQQVIELARDRKSIGRYDIALALAYYGFAHTANEAYGMYLDHKGKTYVSRNKLSPERLIQEIIKNGGVAVLAHPKSLHLSLEDETKFIEGLIEAGLGGIEVYNPNNGRERRVHYNEICEAYDLVATAGSDYHGENRKPKILIGRGIKDNLCISDDDIAKKLTLKRKI